MKKNKARIGKKRRTVYPYDCRRCQKHRIAFDYERAKLGLCKRCEGPKVSPDQAPLFGDYPSPDAESGRALVPSGDEGPSTPLKRKT